MKTKILFTLFVLISSYTFVSGQAQSPIAVDSVRIFQVDTNDGNTYFGKVVEVNAQSIRLETSTLGVLTLKQLDIKQIKEIKHEEIKNGELWFENPQAARYFWAPNGFGLKKGEAYYQNVWVLFNQVSVGVTDYVSVGVGLVPTFLFGAGVTPFWLTPKVSIPITKDKFSVGAGVLYANVVGSDVETGKGIALTYGIATFGSRDRNMSIGLGYGWAEGAWAKKPTVNVSFMSRLTRNGYLISENYIIPTQDGTYGLISIGGRKILKKVGLDFGGFLPMAKDLDRVVIIPWLGITTPLGKKRV